MDKFIAVCILMMIGISIAAGSPTYEPAQSTHSRGCIYILGRCSRECEEGTHAYALGCGHKTPEPTCEEPNPQPETGILCDYSACYCDAPTVRDEISGKCVQPSECPKKSADHS